MSYDDDYAMEATRIWEDNAMGALVTVKKVEAKARLERIATTLYAGMLVNPPVQMGERQGYPHPSQAITLAKSLIEALDKEQA